MYKKLQEKSYLETTSVFFFIYKWKKPLFVVTLLAIICSTIFSSSRFIHPKYKSTAILFPASTSIISKSILEDHGNDKQEFLAFGEEEQAEQLLQILNSNDIRNSIAKKYNLLSHYRIDPNTDFPQTYLEGEYNSNISFQRTEYMSIRIEVLDEDPQMAANIANDIVSFSDSMKNKMQHARAAEATKILQDDYDKMDAHIKQSEDSLHKLEIMGIYDFGIQNTVLNESYGKAMAIYTAGTAALPVLEKYRDENDTMVINTKARVKGAEAEIKDLKTKLNMFSKYGSTFTALKDEIWRNRDRLSKIRERYDRIKADAEQNVTHKFVVNYAEKAEKKSYPVRWLIVLVSTLSAFLFALLFILGVENYNRFKASI